MEAAVRGGGGDSERCGGLAPGDYLCICLLNPSILSQSHLQNVQNEAKVACERFIYYTSSKPKLGWREISLMIIELFRYTETECLDRTRKHTSNNIQGEEKPKAAVWPHPSTGADLRVWCVFAESTVAVHSHGFLPRPLLPHDLWT